MNELPTYLTIALGAAGIFVFWRQGGSIGQKQTSDAFKDLSDVREKQITELKAQMTAQAELFRKQMQDQSNSLRLEINALTAKVGELTGVIKEKNDRIKTLEELNTNRNPEIMTFMAHMEAMAADQSAFRTDLKNFMQNMNSYIMQQATKVAIPAS